MKKADKRILSAPSVTKSLLGQLGAMGRGEVRGGERPCDRFSYIDWQFLGSKANELLEEQSHKQVLSS